jgi:hypothetical protein
LVWVAVGLKVKAVIQKKFGKNTVDEFRFVMGLTIIYVSMNMKTVG